MTKRDIETSLINIISEIVPDEDLSNLDGDARIRDQIELDSMDFLDIIMELRKRYKVEIPEEDYPRLATMNGCIEYLEPILVGR
ncbi:MAG: acyl carrier protein [bacterium]